MPSTSHIGGIKHNNANSTARNIRPGTIHYSRADNAGVNIATCTNNAATQYNTGAAVTGNGSRTAAMTRGITCRYPAYGTTNAATHGYAPGQKNLTIFSEERRIP